MKILNVTQGSAEWLEARAKHFCASDAPAMMGASKYMTRTELLRRQASGDTTVVDEHTQKLFDRGHAAEAAARAVIEAQIGEELYPATISDDHGYLLASYDGITMDGRIGFEHKLWNEELAADVRTGDLAPAYYWQLEQQILIAGLDKVIFVVSDGTPEKMVQMEYTYVPGRAQKLVAGWKQFEEDLKNYRHVEVLPPAVATPVKDLPALSIQVNGSISLISNLDIFGAQLRKFIEDIDKNPSDDQAFADAEAAVKVLQRAQEALEAAESSALAQTASIDDMRRTVAAYSELARTNRLMLEKLVKNRKEALREEIRQDGIMAMAQHINNLNTRLGNRYMPTIAADFAGVMKGKKTIASLRDAVATELARAKIEANEIADKIEINLRTIRDLAGDHRFLFADTAQIVLKANDDLTALIKMRITEHRAVEEKKLEAERERIRKEEAERIEKAMRDEQAKAAPAPEAAPVSATPASSNVVPISKPTRPSDEQIITALALHYRVHESTVVTWLLGMDLKAASDRLAREFSHQ
jgi:putative phage-type endonuclease